MEGSTPARPKGADDAVADLRGPREGKTPIRDPTGTDARATLDGNEETD